MVYYANNIGDKKKNGLAFFFLNLCIMVAPLRCYGLGAFLGGNVSFFRVFGILMIVCVMFDLLKNRTKIRVDGFLSSIAILLCYSIIGITYSSLILKSNFSVMMIGLVWLMFAYILVQKNENRFGDLIFSFLFSAVFPSVLGVYQYIIYSIKGSIPPFPFDSFLVSEGKTGLRFGHEIRIMSTFLDPSYCGMFMMIVILIALIVLLDKDRYSFMLVKWKSIVVLVSLICSFICIIVTLSLSAILGLIISLFVYMLLFKRKKIVKAVFLCIVITGLSVVIIEFVLNVNIIETLLWRYKVTSNKYAGTNSLYGRSEYLKNGLEAWLSRPIFGVGFGDIAVIGISYSAHNSFLTILAQQGLVGFIMHMVLLVVNPVKKTIQASLPDTYKALAYIPLFSIIVQSMGYDLLYKIDPFYVMLLIMMAILGYARNGDLEL